jgi:hypothetical protein
MAMESERERNNAAECPCPPANSSVAAAAAATSNSPASASSGTSRRGTVGLGGLRVRPSTGSWLSIRRSRSLSEGARFDPELINKHAAGLVVALPRVDLASGSVKREHQMAVEPCDGSTRRPAASSSRLRAPAHPTAPRSAVARDDLTPTQQQHCQQGTLLVAAQWNRSVVGDDLKRTQDSELKQRMAPGPRYHRPDVERPIGRAGLPISNRFQPVSNPSTALLLRSDRNRRSTNPRS